MQSVSGYFKREEMFETLQNSDSKYDSSQPAEQVRYEYTTTGSMYEGFMRGGFRDGEGCMTWSDGAKFEGTWVMGYASG